MAEILPFRALHYEAEPVSGLEKVVTQPYDKISSEMQARYYQLSPYNLVRIIRGRETPQDTPQSNIYIRAAHDLGDWLQRGVLVSEREPALYPYFQEYTIPGQAGTRKRRRGFIALCRLEDYSARVIHRHEETLSGPKADRLELLKTTRAHFGQIFMLYSDPENEIEPELAAATASAPWEHVVDEYSTAHSVWRLTDPETIERVVFALREKKLVIADGHHRYETALAYRDSCRAQGRPGERAEYVMVTFVRMESDEITILPTHRMVHSLRDFDWRRFVAGASPFFQWHELFVEGELKNQGDWFLERLREAGREHPAIGVYLRPRYTAILTLKKETDLEKLLPDLPASLRCLDVVILHRILLERILSIDRQAVEEERNLRYVREFEEAIRHVDAGEAQVSFLMNPTPIEAVRDNAFAGLVLPQKSTDFYPKLLSGLTIYWLDNPAGI